MRNLVALAALAAGLVFSSLAAGANTPPPQYIVQPPPGGYPCAPGYTRYSGSNYRETCEAVNPGTCSSGRRWRIEQKPTTGHYSGWWIVTGYRCA